MMETFFNAQLAASDFVQETVLTTKININGFIKEIVLSNQKMNKRFLHTHIYTWNY